MPAPSVASPIRNLLLTNLLNQKGDQVPLPTRLLKWLISSGRYIVIFVEMIVIGAFVYRYKLDADLVGLQEEISTQSAYVQSLKQDEDLIRLTQFQLSSIRQTRDARIDYPEIFTKIATATPEDLRLTNITIERSLTQTAIAITGVTSSNSQLSTFLKLLKQDPIFSQMNLSNISFDSDTVFTIAGQIIPGGGQFQ